VFTGRNESKEFCQALISSPTREEAKSFADILVEERLVAGCLITEGASRYWWEGDIVEKQYWNVQAFTVETNKEKIISIIEDISSDECPIIAFFRLDGNQKFLNWIQESCHQ
jgi:uncharacterized protein involved in tolerance to divalent cations